MLHKDNNPEQATFNALIASAAFPLELCDGKDYMGVIRDREMAQEMHIFELVVVEYAAEHGDEMNDEMSKAIVKLNGKAFLSRAKYRFTIVPTFGYNLWR